jgi:beta-glucosidase
MRPRLAAALALAAVVSAPWTVRAETPKAVTPEVQKDAWAQSFWMPRHQQKVEETAAGVRMILDELKTRMPKAKVLLLAIFPRGEKPADKGRVLNDAINKLIATCADNQRVFFLDVNPKFLQSDGTLPKDLMPDFLHPNEKGYRIWAETMEPAIAKLMGEK